MKAKSNIRPKKASLNPSNARQVSLPKNNLFLLSFDMEKQQDGKWKVGNTPFSFDAAQCQELMMPNNKDLSELGVQVLCETLAGVIEKIADLHEEATGVPASKVKERAISRLERQTKIVSLHGAEN